MPSTRIRRTLLAVGSAALASLTGCIAAGPAGGRWRDAVCLHWNRDPTGMSATSRFAGRSHTSTTRIAPWRVVIQQGLSGSRPRYR